MKRILVVFSVFLLFSCSSQKEENKENTGVNLASRLEESESKKINYAIELSCLKNGMDCRKLLPDLRIFVKKQKKLFSGNATSDDILTYLTEPEYEDSIEKIRGMAAEFGLNATKLGAVIYDARVLLLTMETNALSWEKP